MCTLRLKCSCVCMFTCFVDLVLTCVLALMTTFFQIYLLWWSYAFMFVCFDVDMLWWLHTSTFTCFNYLMLLCLYGSTRTCPFSHMPWCPYARTLWWLDAPTLTCIVDHLHFNSHATMIECFHVYMLWWSLTHLPMCLRAYMHGHFDDYLLLFWNALMIAFSHALIFTCLISTHMCAHLDDEMSIGSKAKVIM